MLIAVVVVVVSTGLFAVDTNAVVGLIVVVVVVVAVKGTTQLG